MDASDIVLVLVVVTALGFDFTNGFHDTANAMATTIATGALRPKAAVTIAAILNFAGASSRSLEGGENFDVPTWVVVSCATAIALGTYCGGWRIIKTLGTKVVEVRPPQGFGSEAVAATVILASSHVGFPLSTTQVVSGAVTGSGVGRPGAAVNWGVAGRIVVGWLLTLPAAAATAGVAYAIVDLFGDGALGTIVVGSALAIGCVLLFFANRRQSVEPEETVSEHPTFGPTAEPVPA